MDQRPAQMLSSDDATMVAAMAAGDAQALKAFYAKHSPGIYALCLRILGNAHDAEDVLVDVFYEYWNRVSSIDARHGSPIGLLVSLARSRAIDRKRALARRKAVTIEEPATAAAASMLEDAQRPDQRVQQSQEAQIVRQAMGQLDANQRKVIECAYYEGMSHSEIAQALGKPLGTVKTYIRQGLLRMRDALKQREKSQAGAL